METPEAKTQHAVEIVVNGRKKEFDGARISFAQVVTLAFGAIDPNTAYTLTYAKGPKENREGSMSAGDQVLVKNEMVFNVTPTGKS